ncbi:hypothetical protein ACQP1P_26410 [Dactylosporangium sp. CA-052675]|uniref:hypothetical protein n=1 Tax=Dactylosporangium sp. CA-052675 TaxID=3239927 RepID=UPI003D902044
MSTVTHDLPNGGEERAVIGSGGNRQAPAEEDLTRSPDFHEREPGPRADADDIVVASVGRMPAPGALPAPRVAGRLGVTLALLTLLTPALVWLAVCLTLRPSAALTIGGAAIALATSAGAATAATVISRRRKRQ